MASGKRKKNKHQVIKGYKNSSRKAFDLDRNGSNAAFRENKVQLIDYLPYTPGALMIIMLLMMLLVEISMTSVDNTQVYDFHNIFRVFNYCAIFLGLIFLIFIIVAYQLRVFADDLFWGLFIFCIIASTIVNGVSSNSLFGIAYRYIGIFNMLAFFIIYLKVSEHISRNSFRYTILTGYLIIADVVALTALYSEFVKAIPAYQNKVGVSAIFFNGNHYGYFLAMAIMLGIGYYVYISGWRSNLGVGSAILNLGLLAINRTMGSLLAVLACITALFISTMFTEKNISIKRKMFAVVGAIVGAGIIVLVFSAALRAEVSILINDVLKIAAGNADGTEGTERLHLWRTTIQYIKERPLLGHGCEGITYRILEETGKGDSHCEPLTYTAYYGIPAGLLYVGGMIAHAVVYFKNRKIVDSSCRAAFLAACAYFISSLFGVAMFNTAPFFFIFLGLSYDASRMEWGLLHLGHN